MERIDRVFQILVSNLCSRYSEDLAGDSEILAEEGSYVNAFCPTYMLAGLSGAHLMTTMAMFMLAVEE